MKNVKSGGRKLIVRQFDLITLCNGAYSHYELQVCRVPPAIIHSGLQNGPMREQCLSLPVAAVTSLDLDERTADVRVLERRFN